MSRQIGYGAEELAAVPAGGRPRPRVRRPGGAPRAAARGDRARPRLGAGPRRPPGREPGGAGRPRDRCRHDARDARARPRDRRPGRREARRFPRGPAGGAAGGGRFRGRGDEQLRDQPRARQGRRLPRGGARPRPGGRVVVSDIVLERPLPEAVAKDVLAWVGCVAGAARRDDYFADGRGGRPLRRDASWRTTDSSPSWPRSPPRRRDALVERSGVPREELLGIVRSVTWRAVKR